MNHHDYRRQLMREIETELAAAGCRTTRARRARMNRLLEQLDHARSRPSSPRSAIPLQYHLVGHHELEDDDFDRPAAARAPSDWLGAVECA